jgi:hypothetical protein
VEIFSSKGRRRLADAFVLPVGFADPFFISHQLAFCESFFIIAVANYTQSESFG